MGNEMYDFLLTMCICGSNAGKYRSMSGHRPDCPEHAKWLEDNILALRGKACMICGSKIVMASDGMYSGVCMECGYSWTGGYPCTCTENWADGPTHAKECAVYHRWAEHNGDTM